ncbi:whirlin isoform X3 [Cimex lectularius]|uniref:PDZ domain-containing protein n=1 Tax=Cimex lectularius TaxID=79782 RepID=A0A8I6RVX9_CIMLE|nr:whirlin isoform X3 [Cimex lectularius]
MFEEDIRWTRGPGSTGGSLCHRPRTRHVNRPAEAEDAVGRSSSHSGLYYSPPGTSYTIVEHKKRPISPEQVLRMLGSGRTGASRERGVHREVPPPPPPPPPQSLLDPHVRTINMNRGPPEAGGHGFGICVKGGSRDSGQKFTDTKGVYISRVEEGSVAERAGLRPGDTILQVNGTPFTNISHEDALKVLKSCRELSITVRSTTPYVPTPVVQPMQGPSIQTYSWVDRKGRPVSPPPRFRQYHRDKLRKVEIVVDPGQSLGLMIRGGIEYNLGIFVTGVDKDSVAERAGLLIGDQILEVNGQSFLEVTHDEAVSQLKCYKRMILKVCDVGKIPHSCSTLDMHWPDTPHRCCVAALQMVDEKARVVLNKNEFNTLTYYLDEYSAKQMTIEAFVAVLLELLNTPDKHTLFTELRELVAMEDRARFDELVYRREQYSSRRGGPCCDNTHDMIMSSLHHMPTPLDCDGWRGNTEDLRTPSEDSGVGLGPLDSQNSRSIRNDRVSPSFKSSTQHISNKEQDTGGSQGHDNNNYDANMCGYLGGLKSQLGGWTQRVKSWYWGNPLVDFGRSGDDQLNSQERDDSSNLVHSQNDQQQAQVIPDEAGNLRIIVKKTKPLLGIAIEGGANTRHPLPRIININENGAAYDAGGLQVGQLILEVDGHKVEGMHHQEVARLIAESFAQRDKPHIEFLVVEAKKSNLEPKPTALIFLEA